MAGWSGSTRAEIAELHFDFVEKGGCFIKRPCKIRFIPHQHVAVRFLQSIIMIMKKKWESETTFAKSCILVQFICIKVRWVCVRMREKEEREWEGGTMNSSSSGSGSAAKHVETSLLHKSFSRRISSNKHAISGGAPTCHRHSKIRKHSSQNQRKAYTKKKKISVFTKQQFSRLIPP